MADRCMLFAARALPTKPGETVPVLALGEFGWDIPTLYKILVSASPQKCRSVVFDQPGPFAIAGDRQGGLGCLAALRAKLPANAPAIPGIDDAIAYLSKPHIDHPYFLLEPGEILALGSGDMQAELQTLFAEVEALRQDDLIALAKTSKEPRDWATDSWSSILYFEPAGSERPPIDPDETFLTTSTTHILQNRAVLSQCKSLKKIRLELDGGAKEFAAALTALGDLPGEFELTLDGQCETLPDAFANLKGLTHLGLGRMGLRSLPGSLTSLPALTGLYLQSNRFDAVPECVRTIRTLKFLSLSHNPLKKLPQWIGELKDLENLLLERCELGELPSELWSLPRLKSLQLGGNLRMDRLPAGIERLFALEDLNLHDCSLETLPEGICKLPRLKTLFVGGNKIGALPACIYDMPLETLSLVGNPIRQEKWLGLFPKRHFRAKKVYWT